MMFTFQDFMEIAVHSVPDAVEKAINDHLISKDYITACDADAYDRQQNTTITRFYKKLFNPNGKYFIDPTANTMRMCSNAFRRLNIQRVMYSLGNGITFATDGIKEKLGKDFDTVLKECGYSSSIHGKSFMMWNNVRAHCFKLTEFVPLWDEDTGLLAAGIRFWRIDPNKPMIAILYEVDGYTKLRDDKTGDGMKVIEKKRAYKITYRKAPVDAEPEVISEENYSALPIVPFYGSTHKQSTLVGLQPFIDAADLIRSGLVDDINECAVVYWILSGAGGMDDKDLIKFRDRLKLTHMASTDDDIQITPHTQDVPFQARQAALADIKAAMYDGFGAIDMHMISAGTTNDHIEAAYQPMDENADDFEYQIIKGVQGILALMGIEETPLFKRNRISNQREQTDMVLSAAQYLDDETILNHLPWISPDEVKSILDKKEAEDLDRFSDADEAEEEQPQAVVVQVDQEAEEE